MAGMKHPLLFVCLSFLALVTLLRARRAVSGAIHPTDTGRAYIAALGWYLWALLPRYSPASVGRSAVVLAVLFVAMLDSCGICTPSPDSWTWWPRPGVVPGYGLYSSPQRGPEPQRQSDCCVWGASTVWGGHCSTPGFRYNVLGGIPAAFPLGAACAPSTVDTGGRI